MTGPDVEADSLQDTLADVARRLRRPGVRAAQLTECASILERIVGDLRRKPTPQASVDAGKSNAGNWWMLAAGGLGVYLMVRRLSSGNR